MRRLTIYGVLPEDVRWARAEARPEQEKPCAEEEDLGSGSAVLKVCPPGGNRGCDWCRQPLPRHAPGDHRPFGAVLTFSPSSPGRMAAKIRHCIHADPCLPVS
jgi:hypothetical protein